jgi:flagellar FliL protein
MKGLHATETRTLTFEARMTDATDVTPAEAPEKPKRRLTGLLAGLGGALVLGGAGFYVTWAGVVDPAGLMKHEAPEAGATIGDVAFVAMEPIMISLPPGASARHLRFTGQLEVEPAEAEAVAQVMPRILDVLNTYLRAVEVRDLEQPSSLARLRAQMLRRVQVVTGDGIVRDLLITEFVLN